MEQNTIERDVLGFEEYLLDEGKSENTIQKYMRDVRKFQQYMSADGRALSQEIVDDYVRYLQDENYGAASINSMVASINTFCRFLGRTEIYCASIRIRKNKEVASELLTVDEYTRLLRTAIDKGDFRLAMIIQVLGNMDIRLNELDQLTVKALKKGYVKVKRAGEEYVIPVTGQLLDGLYEYIEERGITGGAIFCTVSGKPMERTNIWKQLKRLAVDALVDPDKVYPQNLKQKLAKKYFHIIY